MAIQRLGSSLIAKSQSGSRLRTAEEDRQTGAVQRGSTSAQTGSPVRGSVDEPINRLDPQGTQKIVSVQPNIQPTEKGVVNRLGIMPSIGAASRVSDPAGNRGAGGSSKASNPGGGAAPASRTSFRLAQATSAPNIGLTAPSAGYRPGGGGAGVATRAAAPSKQGSVSRVSNPTQSAKSTSAPSSGLGNRIALTAGKGIVDSVKKLAGRAAGPAVEAGELGLRGLSLPIGLGAAIIGGEVKRQSVAKKNVQQSMATQKALDQAKKNPAAQLQMLKSKTSKLSAPSKPATPQKQAAQVVKKATTTAKKATNTIRSAVKSTAKKAGNVVKSAGSALRSLVKKK